MDNINCDLAVFYEKLARTFLSSSRLPRQYVGPFLLSCPRGYEKLTTKWVYVGQETLGWGRLSSPDDWES